MGEGLKFDTEKPKMELLHVYYRYASLYQRTRRPPFKKGFTMTNSLIVDLSQAKVGDTVVFRHGGRMPIGHIQCDEVESHEGINPSYFMRVSADIYSEHIGRFSKNGINERHPYQGAFCEIIFVEKAQ